MYAGLTLGYWLTLHGFVTAVSVLLYAVTAHLRQQRRHPTAAIAWVLFILLMPYLALPIFLTFGSRKLARPRGRPALVARCFAGPDATWAVRTLRALGQGAPTTYRDLHVHADGRAALGALWQTIDGAAESIDLCTFIIGRDAIGSTLIECLCAKARAGVRVRVLLDGLGSLMHSRPSLRPLRKAGAQFTLFVPPLHSPLKGRTNLRNHRKMLIADAAAPTARLWCGGRNLASEYFEGLPDQAPWHDLSFDLCGAAVRQTALLFEHDWAFAIGAARAKRACEAAERVALDRSLKVPPIVPVRVPLAGPLGDPLADPLSDPLAGPVDAPLDARCILAASASAAAAARAATTPPRSVCTTSVQVVASGPDQADDTLYALLLTAAYRARRHIAIVTPYFVPDTALLMALAMAARRGVVVDLLLPNRSNHPLSDMARRRGLRSLAGAGGRIWLAPHMQHAKLVVVDDSLALAGSANLDSRSLFLNYEMMLAFHDPAAVALFAAWFKHERSQAWHYAPQPPGFVADVADGLVLWLGFQL